tara:strand:- start:1976 stop:2506 length:531 start_codon:yes stop_codon:yes gene_type:complete
MLEKLKNFENVTLEKAEYVEKQAERTLEFAMESRKLLTQEAHTTINWLFAIILGCSGYTATLLESRHIPWWLVITLFFVTLISGWQAVSLFSISLTARELIPPGNVPKNLITDSMLQYDIKWIRLAESVTLQERIQLAQDHNHDSANAVNKSRWVIAFLPIIAIAIGIISMIMIGV